MLISKPVALPPEQLAFCSAYVEYDRNAARACKALKIPAATGISWLAEPKVQQGILHELNIQQTQGITEDNVLRQVARMSFWDPRLLVYPRGHALQGRSIPLYDLPDEIAAAIHSVKVKPQQDGSVIYEYEFSDRVRACEKLMKYLGLFELDNRQKADAVGEMLAQVYAQGNRLPIVESSAAAPVQSTAQPKPDALVISGDAIEEQRYVNPFSKVH